MTDALCLGNVIPWEKQWFGPMKKISEEGKKWLRIWLNIKGKILLINVGYEGE